MISVVYTFARVKQAIGRMNILPWSNLWGADDNQQHPAETGDLDKTPMGGLILHWITTVVAISASASIKSSLINAISFPGIVQAYAHSLILIPLSLGFFRIRSLADTLGFNRNDLQLFDRALASFWLSDDWTILGFLALIILAYVACNTFLVVDYVIPPYSGVPGWISLVICSIVIAIAIVYYFSFFASFIPDPDADPNVEADLNARGGLEQTQLSLLRLADVTMHIVKAESFDESTSRARRFGTRRKITYQVSCHGMLSSCSSAMCTDKLPSRTVTASFYIGSLAGRILTGHLGRESLISGIALLRGFGRIDCGGRRGKTAPSRIMIVEDLWLKMPTTFLLHCFLLQSECETIFYHTSDFSYTASLFGKGHFEVHDNGSLLYSVLLSKPRLLYRTSCRCYCNVRSTTTIMRKHF